MTTEYTVRLPRPHARQQEFIDSPAKRKVIRAGRRGGKTVGVGIYAARRFLAGRRVLYAVPTSEQLDTFWYQVKNALTEPIEAGIFTKNETRHIIELPGAKQRIRGKTAWNADSLRGDFADDIIFDEFQLMAEDAWDKVGAPMLLDNDGDAVFIYTPPSFAKISATKAQDPRHAAKLFKKAAADTSGRWETFHFTSHENPYISQEALAELAQDMTSMAYRMEIEAEDIDDVPGALWTLDLLDKQRVDSHPPLHRIVVGVDPAASTGTTGIVVAGVGVCPDGKTRGYVLEDATAPQGSSPGAWASRVVAMYEKWQADAIIAEVNNGGDMVGETIRNIDNSLPVKQIRASRGKYARAEPVSAKYEQGNVHHVGYFGPLEEELCSYVPGTTESPNRLDAAVWAITELMPTYSRPGVKKYA